MRVLMAGASLVLLLGMAACGEKSDEKSEKADAATQTAASWRGGCRERAAG